MTNIISMWDVIARGAASNDHHPTRDMPACKWKGAHNYKLHHIEGEITVEACRYCGERRNFPTAKNSTYCITDAELELLGSGKGLR